MENVQFLIVHVTKIGLYVKIVVLWCASQSRKESPYEAFSRRQTQPMTAILSSRKDLYCYYRGVYADAVRNLLTIFPSLSLLSIPFTDLNDTPLPQSQLFLLFFFVKSMPLYLCVCVCYSWPHSQHDTTTSLAHKWPGLHSPWRYRRVIFWCQSGT